MADSALNFNPLHDGALKTAFLESPSAARADLLSAAVEPMANGLIGVNFVASVADEDPVNFEAGLRRALDKNPKNLTAGRALMWYYIRQNDFPNIESLFAIIAEQWPEHSDIFVEHARVLFTRQAPNSMDFFLAHKRHFRGNVVSTSYELQAVGNHGDQRSSGMMKDLRILGERAFFSMLAKPDNGHASVINAHELHFLWRFSELIATAERIALVGNGPTLAGSGLGEVIDKHDVVIRCNFPEISNFTVDVGAKTDLMFFNESLRARLVKLRSRHPGYQEVLSIGLHPDPAYGFGDLSSERSFSASERNLSFTTTIPPAIRAFIRDICYIRSTTGLMAINLLLFVFQKKMSVFGFDFFDNTRKPHYFSGQIGAYLGHELQYERWYVREFLAKHFPFLGQFFP